MPIIKAAVKTALTDGIVAEVRVRPGAMAAWAGQAARGEIVRKGIARPASAVDREPARAVTVAVANSSDRGVVILIAVNRANVGRRRRRCRR
jgi:hypothetical protein